MNHNLKLLSIYDSRLKQIGEELELLSDSQILPMATKNGLFAVTSILKAAQHCVYDDVFQIVVGAEIKISPDTGWCDQDLNPTIVSIDDSGLIEYTTGMYDTMEKLRERLLAGLATISWP